MKQTQDSLKISPAQVKQVYLGLRSGEQYRQRFADCLEVANSLNDIIQQQNDSLVALDQRLEEYDYQLGQLYDERERAAVEIQKIKSQATPWYRNPVLWAVLGFGVGVFIAN